MRLILLLFDSLNRRALESYGGTTVRTPNFTCLAERAVSFDAHYVGSLPCMPARRDLHTGRLNFLHRSWGPLEPFDNSFPVLLRERGIDDAVTAFYDTEADPGQTRPLDDPATVERLVRETVARMHAHDAPSEACERLGLPVP